jgi:hypothetical protein
MKPFNERVHEINWSSLTHAYGTAEDVPYLLVDLLSDKPEVRDRAHYELLGNIWHQGTTYPATAHAVPFLFELLDSPSAQDKDSIIALLACIAAGEGYFQVHQSIFEKWNPNTDKHEDALKQESIDVRAVRDLISPRLEIILEHITNEESEIRLRVARAAGFYPEYSEQSLQILKQAFKDETDEEVSEEIQESINRLTDNK